MVAEDIKMVVREYIQRMEALDVSKDGTSTDSYIDCPESGCSSYRTVVCEHGEWHCLMINCSFRFPEGFIPPTPQELREFFVERRRVERMVEVADLIRKCGVELL